MIQKSFRKNLEVLIFFLIFELKRVQNNFSFKVEDLAFQLAVSSLVSNEWTIDWSSYFFFPAKLKKLYLYKNWPQNSEFPKIYLCFYSFIF